MSEKKTRGHEEAAQKRDTREMVQETGQERIGVEAEGRTSRENECRREK